MTNVFFYSLASVLGLVVGSFLSALTYRIPRGISILKGRSFCPNCKVKITWRDNIPVFSYYFLGGKCRNCKKTISLRYPLIEFFTLLVFLFITAVSINCVSVFNTFLFKGNSICQWSNLLGYWALPYLLLVSAGFIAIFIIDMEEQIIPDNIVFSLFALTLILLIFINPDFSYLNILAAGGGATFLLLINLATRGKGMGLGDVKLALLGGLVLGWPSTITWFFVSFISGAIVGIILILMKKAEFGKHIPFGPFLVFSFFASLIIGNSLFIALLR